MYCEKATKFEKKFYLRLKLLSHVRKNLEAAYNNNGPPEPVLLDTSSIQADRILLKK